MEQFQKRMGVESISQQTLTAAIACVIRRVNILMRLKLPEVQINSLLLQLLLCFMCTR